MSVIAADVPTKVKIANWYIRRAFTPITRKVKLDNGREPWDTVARTLLFSLPRRGMPRSDPAHLFDTKQEFNEYASIIGELQKVYEQPPADRYYFYVFVRQDISPEYQAVQACHVAAKMGYRTGFHQGLQGGAITSTAAMPPEKFDELYITLIGVPDIAALGTAIEDIKAVGGKAYEFREPDINNELTAVASSPILAKDRKRLLSYKRLVFNK